jgi:uncharacterized protein (TIGR02453 family)
MFEKSFSFLQALKKHNEREWFSKNKALYDEARLEFEHITELIIHEVATFDKEVVGLNPKDCIFRIFRDIRFSNDKTPYKTNFGAYFAGGGRKSPLAGYYVHIEPGESMLAGGLYMPPSPILNAVRKEIFTHIDEFNEIISEKAFVRHFGGFTGESLKTAPKGFPKDFKHIDLLKFKNYTVIEAKPDNEMQNNSILKEITEVFKVMYPLNRFLNEVIREVNQ